MSKELHASGDITVDMKRNYLAKHGAVCPYCGSHNINAGEGEFEYVATQEVSCDDCGAVWRDTYELIDIEPVGPPRKTVCEKDRGGPVGWNDEHETIAAAEGWSIFVSNNVFTIQKIDEIGRFAGDEEALEFVKLRASQGSETAKCALLYHGCCRNDPVDGR